jgi:hypothetical protein
MMTDREKSGYGVFHSRQSVSCVRRGRERRAANALKGTEKKDNLKVKVSGDIDGDTIRVASLTLQ